MARALPALPAHLLPETLLACAKPCLRYSHARAQPASASAFAYDVGGDVPFAVLLFNAELGWPRSGGCAQLRTAANWRPCDCWGQLAAAAAAAAPTLCLHAVCSSQAITAMEPALAPCLLDEQAPPPADLCCPITRQLMVDPVMLVDSSQTYDRAAIQEWLDRGNLKDPVTGAA